LRRAHNATPDNSNKA